MNFRVSDSGTIYAPKILSKTIRTSLVVHWLTSPSTAGGVGLIPGVGAKIPKQKEYFNEFNKDFKNAQHLYLYIYSKSLKN